jgi:anti-sigma factor RsiW
MTESNGTASSRRERASASIENNPLALVAGGVALGVVIGALLPRLAKEKELLAPVGKRIAEGASAAAAAARDAGKAEIEAILPQRDTAKEQLGKIIGTAFTAAKDAARTRTDA